MRSLWILRHVQIKALKDLGLNVIRGVVTSEGPNMRRKKFLVTRSYVNQFAFLTSLPQYVEIGHVSMRGLCFMIVLRFSL